MLVRQNVGFRHRPTTKGVIGRAAVPVDTTAGKLDTTAINVGRGTRDQLLKRVDRHAYADKTGVSANANRTAARTRTASRGAGTGTRTRTGTETRVGATTFGNRAERKSADNQNQNVLMMNTSLSRSQLSTASHQNHNHNVSISQSNYANTIANDTVKKADKCSNGNAEVKVYSYVPGGRGAAERAVVGM